MFHAPTEYGHHYINSDADCVVLQPDPGKTYLQWVVYENMVITDNRVAVPGMPAALTILNGNCVTLRNISIFGCTGMAIDVQNSMGIVFDTVNINQRDVVPDLTCPGTVRIQSTNGVFFKNCQIDWAPVRPLWLKSADRIDYDGTIHGIPTGGTQAIHLQNSSELLLRGSVTWMPAVYTEVDSNSVVQNQAVVWVRP